MRVRVEGRQAALQNAALSEYMTDANLRFIDLPLRGTVTANIVNFPAQTFGHVILPPATIEWPRDRLSRDRVLVLVTSDERFEVSTEGRVLYKQPDFILVPPGSEPVRFRTYSPSTELIYVSSDVSMLADIVIPEEQSEITGTVPSTAAVPLTSFVTALCSITTGGVTSAEPIAQVAQEVGRSLVRIFGSDERAQQDLFTAAMEIIVREHARIDLSGAVVAKRLRVATRTLQHAFAQRGTTFSAQLRAVRVKAANEIRKRNPAISVRQLAAASGFGSISTLLRALRDDRTGDAAAGGGD
ncbi:MAG: helix-turn-helix domain-containing protein [Humibacter sp.]